jgi:hypothetical protein
MVSFIEILSLKTFSVIITMSKFAILDLQDKSDQDRLLLTMFQRDGTELLNFCLEELITHLLIFLLWPVLSFNFT